jgi:hypothetical protein
VYFGQPKNDDCCVLSDFCLVYLPFVILTRNSVVLWHTGIRHVIEEQRRYAIKIMNGRYKRQNQITHNDHHSWVGLGPIYPNRVYLVTNLSCIALFSIENMHCFV